MNTLKQIYDSEIIASIAFLQNESIQTVIKLTLSSGYEA